MEIKKNITKNFILIFGIKLLLCFIFFCLFCVFMMSLVFKKKVKHWNGKAFD